MEAGIVDTYDGNAFPGNFDLYLCIVENSYSGSFQTGLQILIFRNSRLMIARDIVAGRKFYCFFRESQRNRNIGLSRVDQISGYRDHIRLCFPQHLQKTLVSVAKLCIVQI